jgi:yecA family protein
MPAQAFHDLDETLRRAGTACDAAESHGTLCGALCAGLDSDAPWLDHILDEATGSPEAQRRCREALTALRDSAHGQLAGGSLEFTPILPDDELSLADRTDALSEWCQGFLYGIGLAGDRLKFDELSEETSEILKDISHVSQAGFEGSEASEEDETAYAEIVEYVRMGVQLIYEELQAPAEVIPSSDTVH